MPSMYQKEGKKISQKLETYISNNTNNIIGGDFKMVEYIPNDRAGGNPTTEHYGIEHKKNIENTNNMIDISRKQNSSILENKGYKNKKTSSWQKWQQRKRKCEDPSIWRDNGKKFIQGIITKDSVRN